MDKNFLIELLKMQKKLQSTIKQERLRDVYDIRLSYIAELIEFIQETSATFKTWKTKKVDENAKLEEYVDALFFILEELNKEDKKNVRKLTNDILWIYDEEEKNKISLKLETYNLIMMSILSPSTKIIKYFKLAKLLNYDLNTIIETYKRKWQKNMERIGKDWN